MKTDVVKAVIFDRGQKTLGRETKHVSLIAMVVVSDEPIATADEAIAMGACNISEEISKLHKYKPPHNLGEIGRAIMDVSYMAPEDLEEEED